MTAKTIKLFVATSKKPMEKDMQILESERFKELKKSS